MSNDDGQAAFRAAENLKALVPYMTIDALVDLVGIGNVFCHLSLASSPALTAPVAAASTSAPAPTYSSARIPKCSCARCRR